MSLTLSKTGVYNTVGGRHSVSGITATVFGATGFLGRYVVQKLGAMGCRVILPHRGDELYMRHFKPMGDLGAINFQQMSIRSLSDIQDAVSESNVVINMLGARFETRRWSFTDVNASFPSVLGEVCAEQGVERVIHMSALGASVESPSKLLRSKALGETGLLEGFPSATIMRPAVVFGDEDRLFNNIVMHSRHLPLYPVINGGGHVMQPVFAEDVASAVVKAATNPETAGKIYTLCGPKVATFKELVDFSYKVLAEESPAVSVPNSIAMTMAKLVEQLPNPWLTQEEFIIQSLDLTMPEGALGLTDLGVKPTAFDPLVERYLLAYRKESAFIDPSEKTYVEAPSK